MRFPIALNVLQASIQSCLAQHPTQHASTVRQGLIWTPLATMRCLIVRHVMQASTLAYMGHHSTKRA
jgi:hypothetical protein